MENQIVSILKKLPKGKEWMDQNLSLVSVVMHLLKNAKTKEIISVANETRYGYLLAKIIIEHYEKIDSENLVKLACKLSSMSETHDNKREIEEIFSREKPFEHYQGVIVNPILSKILNSNYFNDSKNLESALRESLSRNFAKELLCLNKLTKDQFSTILKKYFFLKKKENYPKFIYGDLNYFLDRRDVYPGKNFSLEYFSIDDFKKIFKNGYAGYDFIKDVLLYLSEKEPESLKMILGDNVMIEVVSESNSLLLLHSIKLSLLETEQVLAVAKKYSNDHWLLEECLKSKPIENTIEEKEEIKNLLDIARKRNYRSGYSGRKDHC